MVNGTKPDDEAAAEGSRTGWLVGDELASALSEEGAVDKYEQRWPFRATSAGQEDWEGRSFIL